MRQMCNLSCAILASRLPTEAIDPFSRGLTRHARLHQACQSLYLQDGFISIAHVGEVNLVAMRWKLEAI